MYVIEIRLDSNMVVLGIMDELICNGMMVYKVNLMKYEYILDGIEVLIKICYCDNGMMSWLMNYDDKISVEFFVNVWGVVFG